MAMFGTSLQIWCLPSFQFWILAAVSYNYAIFNSLCVCVCVLESLAVGLTEFVGECWVVWFDTYLSLSHPSPLTLC